MTPEEVYQAINAGNVAALKAVKGIGAKSAQRIIVDLKDKLEDLPVDGENLHIQHNTLREEALSALVALGFNRQLAQKGLSKVFKTHPDMNRVEELIKETLKAI
jgi:Holliday junction DNA helicase RuvA